MWVIPARASVRNMYISPYIVYILDASIWACYGTHVHIHKLRTTRIQLYNDIFQIYRIFFLHRQNMQAKTWFGWKIDLMLKIHKLHLIYCELCVWQRCAFVSTCARVFWVHAIILVRPHTHTSTHARASTHIISATTFVFKNAQSFDYNHKIPSYWQLIFYWCSSSYKSAYADCYDLLIPLH